MQRGKIASSAMNRFSVVLLRAQFGEVGLRGLLLPLVMAGEGPEKASKKGAENQNETDFRCEWEMTKGDDEIQRFLKRNEKLFTTHGQYRNWLSFLCC